MKLSAWHFLFGLSLLSSATFAAWRWSSARALRHELDRIAASGAPLSTADVPVRAGEPAASALRWYELVRAAPDDAGVLAVARRAREFRPFDAGEFVHASPSSASPLVAVRASEALARAVSDSARDCAWTDARRDATALFELARLHEGARTMAGAMTWAVLRRLALDAAGELVASAPPSLDLFEIEALAADAPPPRELLASAIEVERAVVVESFARVASGAGVPAFLAMHHALVGSHDQMTALCGFREALEDARTPAWKRRERDGDLPNRWLAPIAAIVFPRPFARIATVDELEARTFVVRFALAARRAGEKEARSLLADAVDPFDGRPLRSRLVDGSLRAWSIGRDRLDDGGDRGRDVAIDVPIDRGVAR